MLSALNVDAVAELSKIATERGLPLHPLLRRGKISAQNNFDKILAAHAAKNPFFILVQRRPTTAAINIGQLTPFVLAAYLQKLFQVPVVIEIKDATVFLRQETTFENVAKAAKENIKDILAVGFDLSKTFVFQDSAYVDALYRSVLKIQKTISYEKARDVLKLTESDNTGLPGNLGVQVAATLASSYPHIFPSPEQVSSLLIGTAEQESLYEFAIEAAKNMGQPAPAILAVDPVPSILGVGNRMTSAALDIHQILSTDTANQIKKKINSYAFSGGRDTKEAHREFGGNIAVDIPYHYLSYFLQDDAELETIGKTYTTGELLTGEIKQKCIANLQEFLGDLQTKRKEITDQVVQSSLSRKTFEL